MTMGESNLFPNVISAVVGKSGQIFDAGGNIIFGFNSAGGIGAHGLITVGKRDGQLALIGPPYDQIVLSAAQLVMLCKQADGVSDNTTVVLDGTGLTITVSSGHTLHFTANGELQSSNSVTGQFFQYLNSVLDPNGAQVLTAQQPAVANATGAGDVVAQLNSLLAALRTHGLIAT